MFEQSDRQNVQTAAAHATGGQLLEGRVALVTGASRGIGAAIATLLAQHGAAVGVNFMNSRDAAQAVVDGITSAGGKAIPVQADVCDSAQIEAMVSQVSQTFGPIDILVLNAASVPHFVMKPFVQLSWDDFEGMVSGELKSVFMPCKAVVPGMIERNRGSIIAISSGLSRVPKENMSALSTGKSGVDAFIKSLALELGPHGITANVIAPGLIPTDASAKWTQSEQGRNDSANVARFTPLRRLGTPEDIAGAVVYLASPLSGFVTGMYLPVSGGIQML